MGERSTLVLVSEQWEMETSDNQRSTWSKYIKIRVCDVWDPDLFGYCCCLRKVVALQCVIEGLIQFKEPSLKKRSRLPQTKPSLRSGLGWV